MNGVMMKQKVFLRDTGAVGADKMIGFGTCEAWSMQQGRVMRRI